MNEKPSKSSKYVIKSFQNIVNVSKDKTSSAYSYHKYAKPTFNCFQYVDFYNRQYAKNCIYYVQFDPKVHIKVKDQFWDQVEYIHTRGKGLIVFDDHLLEEDMPEIEFLIKYRHMVRFPTDLLTQQLLNGLVLDYKLAVQQLFIKFHKIEPATSQVPLYPILMPMYMEKKLNPYILYKNDKNQKVLLQRQIEQVLGITLYPTEQLLWRDDFIYWFSFVAEQEEINAKAAVGQESLDAFNERLVNKVSANRQPSYIDLLRKAEKQNRSTISMVCQEGLQVSFLFEFDDFVDKSSNIQAKKRQNLKQAQIILTFVQKGVAPLAVTVLSFHPVIRRHLSFQCGLRYGIVFNPWAVLQVTGKKNQIEEIPVRTEEEFYSCLQLILDKNPTKRLYMPNFITYTFE